MTLAKRSRVFTARSRYCRLKPTIISVVSTNGFSTILLSQLPLFSCPWLLLCNLCNRPSYITVSPEQFPLLYSYFFHTTASFVQLLFLLHLHSHKTTLLTQLPFIVNYARLSITRAEDPMAWEARPAESQNKLVDTANSSKSKRGGSLTYFCLPRTSFSNDFNGRYMLHSCGSS